QAYSDIIAELKHRGVLRTKNVLGELGEHLVIDHYNSTPGLPKLQLAQTGTENVDATSRQGERYSIKSISRNVTGVFHGLNPPASNGSQKQLFEHVIIAKFNDTYQLEMIIELGWAAFLKHKKWHKRMRAYNLVLSKALLEDSKVVFEGSSS
ncbi:MAG: hypothetical protein KDB96_19845, partial [Flavobacteriales bacterium]|nr:hypothetical protein [Flavobacteriales bacterium]